VTAPAILGTSSFERKAFRYSVPSSFLEVAKLSSDSMVMAIDQLCSFNILVDGQPTALWGIGMRILVTTRSGRSRAYAEG
jgi:hypothetical protein